MSKKIYAIPHINLPTQYFNRRTDAALAQRASEQPERILVLDPSEECEGLSSEVLRLERLDREILLSLKDLVAIQDKECWIESEDAKQAIRLVYRLEPGFIEGFGQAYFKWLKDNGVIDEEK